MIFLTILSVFVIFVITPLFHYRTLLLYQLGGYRLGETVTAIKRIGIKRLLIEVIVTILFTALSFTLYYAVGEKETFFILLPLVAVAILNAVIKNRKAKIKLKLTKRLKRFVTIFATFTAILFSPLIYFYPPLISEIPTLFPLVILPVAHAVISPVENKKNALFVDKAKRELERRKLVKIGITGSYGKTTVKQILSEFLSEKYSVCATSGNYNTPMGIALTVDKTLKDEDEVFIAEMGARYRGDIKKLCEIVSPSVAIITAIGTQHQDTFGSEENLLREKGELINSLSKGGIALFNGDDEKSRILYDNCKVERLIAGRDEEFVKAYKKGKNYKSKFDASYGKVTYFETGCSFTLVVEGKSVEITTSLLGEHIPLTISLCALCAVRMGVSLQKIKKRTEGLKAVAHRLELLYNGNDIIIDDAYNGSEQSVKSALTALSRFVNRVRVVITPGVVELGSLQNEANEKIGVFCADTCSYALFVGVNAQSLKRGAIKGGMDKSRIFTFDTLDKATEKLKQIKGERAVLFANDLPDNY